MTEAQIARELRHKWPSQSPRATRRSKLKSRYGNRLADEIRRTREKLDLLVELKTEQEQRQIAAFEGKA